MAEKIEKNPKAPKLKADDRVRVTIYKNIFSKGYTENLSKEIFLVDSLLNVNPWMNKIKDLNRETIIGSFYDKKLLWSKLLRSYYPEQDILIRDNVRLIIDLPNYATKQN